jgi:hypothetical protein
VTDPSQAEPPAATAPTPASTPGAEPAPAPALDAAHVTPDTAFEDRERAVGIDPDEPLPGERGLRILLFGAIAVFGIPAVIGGGIAAGYPIVGIVLAVALGAVCLLFARPRHG